MNQHGMFRLDSVGYGDMDGDMDRGMGIINPLKSWDLYCIPSGKHTTNYGKLPFLMGKSTISMAIFNSYVSHYQRVPMMFGFPNSHCVLDDHESQKLSFWPLTMPHMGLQIGDPIPSSGWNMLKCLTRILPTKWYGMTILGMYTIFRHVHFCQW